MYSGKHLSEVELLLAITFIKNKLKSSEVHLLSYTGMGHGKSILMTFDYKKSHTKC